MVSEELNKVYDYDNMNGMGFVAIILMLTKLNRRIRNGGKFEKNFRMISSLTNLSFIRTYQNIRNLGYGK